MATAAAVTEEKKFAEARQDLVSRIDTLAREVRTLEERLRSEQTKLAALVAERPTLARQLAMGKAKPEAGRELAVSLAESEMRCEGLVTLIREAKETSAPLEAQLGELQTAEAYRLRVVQLESDKVEAMSEARKADEQTGVLLDTLGKLDAINDRILRNFVNVGGVMAPTGEGDQLAVAARQILTELKGQFLYGEISLRERELLKEGYRRSGTIAYGIASLRPPKG